MLIYICNITETALNVVFTIFSEITKHGLITKFEVGRASMTNVFDYGDLTPDNHLNFLKVKLTSHKYCSSEFHINKSTLNLK